ncbi:DUF3800 domain-containing protein [Sphingobium sp. DC-2]|uniref:DUF3800 domain-containing protein n=1 Tax=Sphingobium sp. DC-2 TaxID=1303256 RepID=UPI0004C3616A|nr:DUF3800 domain-containing protein [Sphingobium sp. DC-2]
MAQNNKIKAYSASALFGGKLGGDLPVRYIYIDEAGTSANEPVTVVVGVIISPDEQYFEAEKMVAEVLDRVPLQFRSKFIFHAKSIWGDPKYRDGWSREDRKKLILDMCDIPRRLRLPIALGKVRRDSGGQSVIDQRNIPMKLSEWHHFMAFAGCLVRADAYLRDSCGPREVATVIAEDVPTMRQRLREAVTVAKAMRPALPPDPNLLRPTQYERATGRTTQQIRWGIERIRDGIHFAEKGDAPFLQIADACAFAFRRFFAQQDGGDELVRSILGYSLAAADWSGPISQSLFDPLPTGTVASAFRASPDPI